VFLDQTLVTDPCGVAEEAEFAYKDLAAVVDVLRRINMSPRVGSFTLIGNIKG
jgi:RNA-splicing ligase RtcB